MNQIVDTFVVDECTGLYDRKLNLYLCADCANAYMHRSWGFETYKGKDRYTLLFDNEFVCDECYEWELSNES